MLATQHDQITAAFKNQIDWIPLSTGSIRPTQGRTLAMHKSMVAHNPSTLSIPCESLDAGCGCLLLRTSLAYVQPGKPFTSASDAEAAQLGAGRMKASSNRDRVVDVCEELVKFTCLLRGKDALFSDRFLERKERIAHGRLLTQAEKDRMLRKTRRRR